MFQDLIEGNQVIRRQPRDGKKIATNRLNANMSPRMLHCPRVRVESGAIPPLLLHASGKYTEAGTDIKQCRHSFFSISISLRLLIHVTHDPPHSLGIVRAFRRQRHDFLERGKKFDATVRGVNITAFVESLQVKLVTIRKVPGPGIRTHSWTEPVSGTGTSTRRNTSPFEMRMLSSCRKPSSVAG